jgi:hypothetical protein
MKTPEIDTGFMAYTLWIRAFHPLEYGNVCGTARTVYCHKGSARAMPERNFEPMTKAEVVAAQRAWAKYVTEQDVENLLALYDYSDPDQPALFKPTLANVIRLDEKGARAYFVGGDSDYPQDSGFLFNGWKTVEFKSAAGPILAAGGLEYKDMGHYTFTNGAGDETHVDYTFAYHKINGRVLVSLHHSSLTWVPPVEG